MRKTYRQLEKELAAAHHDNRQLASKVDSSQHELRVQIAALEKENRELRRVADEHVRLKTALRTGLSDGEIVALSAYVAAETREPTPARERLRSELELRGILDSGKVVPR